MATRREVLFAEVRSAVAETVPTSFRQLVFRLVDQADSKIEEKKMCAADSFEQPAQQRNLSHTAPNVRRANEK
jgi:hypothetical protein